jgi:hypothetical protein
MEADSIFEVGLRFLNLKKCARIGIVGFQIGKTQLKFAPK